MVAEIWSEQHRMVTATLSVQSSLVQLNGRAVKITTQTDKTVWICCLQFIRAAQYRSERKKSFFQEEDFYMEAASITKLRESAGDREESRTSRPSTRANANANPSGGTNAEPIFTVMNSYFTNMIIALSALTVHFTVATSQTTNLAWFTYSQHSSLHSLLLLKTQPNEQ